MKTFRQIIAKAAVPYWRFFVLFVLLGAGAALFDVLVTRVTGDLSNAATSMDTGALGAILLTMAGLTGVKIVCAALNVYLSNNMEGHVETRLRSGFARHFAHISFQDLTARPTGDVLSLYTNDLPRSGALLTGELLNVISSALVLVASAVFMFGTHWLYTLIFFLSFPLLTFVQVAVSKPIASLVAESSRRRGVFNGVVNDCLQNTSLVLGYGLEDAMEQRYLGAYEAYFQMDKKRIHVLLRLTVAGILSSFAPVIFLCLAGALAVVRQTLNIGEFLVLFLLGINANEGLMMLSQNLSSIREQQASAQRVLEATAQPHEKLSRASVLQEGGMGEYALELDDVSFSYDGETPAVKNVSLRIPRGARVAFVGKSGCGKSTLAKLMLGLYAPEKGNIRWLGNDALETQDARKAIAYVPQDSFLFPGTVAENLRCGLAPKDDENRLWAALEGAELSGFIKARDGGLAGIVDEGGENLSGGQRQRLAIARALYRGAPILLLDEGTSALDPATEDAVLKRLAQTAREQTVVMIAHRLAAVAASDTVYLMENGEIIETGSYRDLMRPGTRFYELYIQQQQEDGSHEE